MKIATAIMKFNPPFISYQTPCIIRRVFRIYVNKYKSNPFMRRLASPKNRKKKGKESIFRIGRIVTFITHRIIHPIR